MWTNDGTLTIIYVMSVQIKMYCECFGTDISWTFVWHFKQSNCTLDDKIKSVLGVCDLID